MSRFLIALFFAIPALCLAQNDTLNTLEKLYPKPQKVTSIKLNAYRDGKIDTLLPSIASFERLEILWLSDHGLYSVPKEIGSLKRIQEISFAGNRLTELPDEIYQLKTLREIVLLNNRFSEAKIAEIKERFAKELPRCKVLI